MQINVQGRPQEVVVLKKPSLSLQLHSVKLKPSGFFLSDGLVGWGSDSDHPSENPIPIDGFRGFDRYQKID